ncbi:MAG: excinuclease ABC subunit UvrA [Bacteroidota bacterium]
MIKKGIEVKNVRVHNLKNISLVIPYDKLIVVTGLSGSGKSSFVFDTLYAEGQRRYIESLSSYARQFFGRLKKPDVDMITGIPPAIAIQQKVGTRSSRSTVGTMTEIYDYLKLLYARIGKTYSPVSGNLVKKQNVNDVVEYLSEKPEGTKVFVCFPMDISGDRTENWLENLKQKGFRRLWINRRIRKFDELKNVTTNKKSVCVVLDRLKNRHDKTIQSRIRDSAEMAFKEGEGKCVIVCEAEGKYEQCSFSNIFEEDGITFEEPTENMFSFNNPVGACPECEGYGSVIGIDEDLVIPDPHLSVWDDCVVAWKGDKMRKWKDQLIINASKVDFPVHRPYIDLTSEQKQMLWEGCDAFYGINDFFKYIDKKKYKIQYRVMLSRYRGRTKCPLCKGKRLKKEAGWVKINDKSLPDLVDINTEKLLEFVDNVKLDQREKQIAERILTEIRSRLKFMIKVGLPYLTINRHAASLSGGETQRINLVTSLGSALVGSLYILDEPSIGLHPRDTHLLTDVLKNLRDLQNTVVVVEHEEAVIREADHVIDIGPGAGYQGGEIVFEGSLKQLLDDDKSITADYLNGKRHIPVPQKRKPWQNSLKFYGLRQHNLKIDELELPLEVMCVITGVSGSGKSTFVRDIVTPVVKRKIGDFRHKPGLHKSSEGDFSLITDVQYVDQQPIGKSSRSNPVTYIKAWDDIRLLFAGQKLSEQRDYRPAYFSFNVDGGRCEVCKGEGQIKVEMQFMADVYLTCDECHGRRFKDEILEVKYRGKNIADILDMTINQAVDFFSQSQGNYEKHIVSLLKNYQNVGLGYLKMGQASNTLSGGESQRIKLASYLSRETQTPALFIFDEPTTGLHFHDIHKLLSSLEQLKYRGHSILIIEHNPEIVKSADWVIDLGPEGGDKGGELVFSGTPEQLIKCDQSYTGQYLKDKIKIQKPSSK